jgi:hypothetical protein
MLIAKHNEILKIYREPDSDTKRIKTEHIESELSRWLPDLRSNSVSDGLSAEGKAHFPLFFANFITDIAKLLPPNAKGEMIDALKNYGKSVCLSIWTNFLETLKGPKDLCDDTEISPEKSCDGTEISPNESPDSANSQTRLAMPESDNSVPRRIETVRLCFEKLGNREELGMICDFADQLSNGNYDVPCWLSYDEMYDVVGPTVNDLYERVSHLCNVVQKTSRQSNYQKRARVYATCCKTLGSIAFTNENGVTQTLNEDDELKIQIEEIQVLLEKHFGELLNMKPSSPSSPSSKKR